MIELLRQQLADAREREQAYREQLALLGNMLQEAHKQNQRLLDMPRQVVSTAQAQPVTVPGPQRRAQAIPETWQRILGYMQQQGKAVSPIEVQNALKLPTEARHAMNRMVQRGVIQRVGPGVYGLVE